MLFSKALEIELTRVCGTINVCRSINFELITVMKICYFKGQVFYTLVSCIAWLKFIYCCKFSL